MRRVLSWALARSPGDRDWACARLASFCEAGLPLHPTSPGQAHDQVRLTGQLRRLNTDYWQAESRRKPAAGEGQATGEYASGEILDEDQDGTLGSRFRYAFWCLCEQRIANQQSAEPSHSARVTAARARVAPDLRIVALRRATSPGQSAGQAGTHQWHHHWVVRMHKVRQWYPSLQQHKVLYRGPRAPCQGRQEQATAGRGCRARADPLAQGARREGSLSRLCADLEFLPPLSQRLQVRGDSDSGLVFGSVGWAPLLAAGGHGAPRALTWGIAGYGR
jgi:hypothetical protein